MVVSITVTVKREPCLGREGFATRGGEEWRDDQRCHRFVVFFASASQWINYTKSPWRIYRVRVNRAVLESNNTGRKTHAMLEYIQKKT